MNTKSDKTEKVESKQIYTVGNRNFKEKETAEYYAELGECCERYLAAAKAYEEFINLCQCNEKAFIRKSKEQKDAE